MDNTGRPPRKGHLILIVDVSFAFLLLLLLLLSSPHASTTSNHLFDRHQGSPSGEKPLPWPRAAA